MRVTVLFLVAALGILAPRVALAEKVRTNQSTKVYSRPGEQSKVILTLKTGQSMKVLDREGRWFKVRVKGRTGYVPRSKVDSTDDGAIARNTRRRPFVDGRSRRRGFGAATSAPDDRIGADALGDGVPEDEFEDEEEVEERRSRKPKPKPKPRARDDEEEEEDLEDEEFEDEEELDEEEERPTARVGKKVAVYAEPDEDSDEEFVVRPTDILYPMETEGEWTFVETDEGDGGWIRTALLEIEGAGGTGKRTIDVRARMGVTFIQQAMRTSGSTVTQVPDNYRFGTSSVTVSLGGGIMFPFGKRYLLGAELTYDYANTLLGGVAYDPDGAEPMPPVNIGMSVHNINVRAIGGIDFEKKSGMAVFGRLGYRYQGFLISDVTNLAANPARLPSEVVKAPTVGAAFSMPKLTDAIGLRVSLDAILLGASVRQTVGLEDGTAPTLKAVTLGAGVTYRWKPQLALMAVYDLNYMGIDFGPPAPSMRGHMGNNVTRTDIFHTVTFGVARPL